MRLAGLNDYYAGSTLAHGTHRILRHQLYNHTKVQSSVYLPITWVHSEAAAADLQFYHQRFEA